MFGSIMLTGFEQEIRKPGSNLGRGHCTHFRTNNSGGGGVIYGSISSRSRYGLLAGQTGLSSCVC